MQMATQADKGSFDSDTAGGLGFGREGLHIDTSGDKTFVKYDEMTMRPMARQRARDNLGARSHNYFVNVHTGLTDDKLVEDGSKITTSGGGSSATTRGIGSSMAPVGSTEAFTGQRAHTVNFRGSDVTYRKGQNYAKAPEMVSRPRIRERLMQSRFGENSQ